MKTENGKLKTENSFIKIKMFDVLGKEISTLVKKKQPPGTYEVHFNGGDLSSGIYFYRLLSNGKIIDTKYLYS